MGLSEKLLKKHLSAVPKVVNSKGVVGSTGYIDSITKSHFAKGKPIVRGTDKYGREYVAFKVCIMNDGIVIGDYIYTAFYRYTDAQKVVMCKSHDSESGDYLFEQLFRSGNAVVNEEDMNTLQDLFANFFDGNGGSIHEFEIFDEEKEDYVKVLYSVKLA
jgi:hypothetical protein